MSPGRRLALLTVLVPVVMLAGCAVLDSPGLGVLRLYQSLQNQDDAAYRTSMDPDLRDQPNPFYLLDALRFAAGLQNIGLGTGLESFTQLGLSDLHYRTVDQAGDRAHVRVTGTLRLAALGVEAPFCDEHLVRRIGGRWLVSYDEVEHTAKVDRWQRRWSQLMEDLGPSNIGSSVAGMLNFCE
jgi:hypothetical protein